MRITAVVRVFCLTFCVQVVPMLAQTSTQQTSSAAVISGDSATQDVVQLQPNQTCAEGEETYSKLVIDIAHAEQLHDKYVQLDKEVGEALLKNKTATATQYKVLLQSYSQFAIARGKAESDLYLAIAATVTCSEMILPARFAHANTQLANQSNEDFNKAVDAMHRRLAPQNDRVVRLLDLPRLDLFLSFKMQVTPVLPETASSR